MTKTNKITRYKIKMKTCLVCGHKFPVKIRYPDRRIMSKCFHSWMSKYYFDGWSYYIGRLDDILFNEKLNTDKIHFKNKFYKIIGFSNISRKIYYFIWKLFHFGHEEYWECDKCCGDM